MTWQEVAAEVERIKTLVGDPEVFHAAEDALWAKVLETMAEWDGCEIAREALKTRDIKGTRWYA